MSDAICGFCKKNQAINEIDTPDGKLPICDSCLARWQAMKDKRTATAKNEPKQESAPAPTTPSADTGSLGFKLPAPAEIRAHLDEYVIEQEDAKKVLAVAVYNHYKRINYSNATEGGIEIKKSNIMMIGTTGSGKTLLASTLAKILNVPFAEVDSTTFLTTNITTTIENILLKLIANADDDIKRAESGIVYLDEIDKISSKYNRAGEGIQQALLKIIEGSVTTIPFKGEKVEVDTKNVLFVVGGAFVGLDAVVRTRMGDTKAGLLETTDLIKEAIPEDFSRFGMIPEFIGRIPTIVSLKTLGKGALIDALTKPKNALVAQYKKMFAIDNIELEFTDASLEKIAEAAIELKTGARGLRTIMENSMRDIMYNVPSEKNLSKITITENVIMKSGTATFDYNEAREEIELIEPPINISKTITAYAD